MTKYYEEDSNIPNLEKVIELAWILRYGNEKAIINDRLFLAHILNLYIYEMEKTQKLL